MFRLRHKDTGYYLRDGNFTEYNHNKADTFANWMEVTKVKLSFGSFHKELIII